MGGMCLEKGISQIVIETMVRNALRDIKEDPERSLRNLVDMALHFSKGRFQKRFLEIVQKMLENENSAYYTLVWDVVKNVENEKLINFGMNIGYNSCTLGAQKIREWEQENGYNVPWAVFIEIGNHFGRYHELVSEGEQIGIFTWLLFVDNNTEEVLSLIEKHSDSAFIVFCNAELMTEEWIDGISSLKNTMLVIEYDENAADICRRLRSEKLLYGVYYCYTAKDVQSIGNGDLFYDVQPLHPTVTILMPTDKACCKIQEQVYEMVLDARESQQYPTVALELQGDVSLIDKVISGESCLVYFNKEGDLCNIKKEIIGIKQILLQNSLKEILMGNFQKNNFVISFHN